LFTVKSIRSSFKKSKAQTARSPGFWRKSPVFYPSERPSRVQPAKVGHFMARKAVFLKKNAIKRVK
jgi:hypothetical protein